MSQNRRQGPSNSGGRAGGQNSNRRSGAGRGNSNSRSGGSRGGAGRAGGGSFGGGKPRGGASRGGAGRFGGGASGKPAGNGQNSRGNFAGDNGNAENRAEQGSRGGNSRQGGNARPSGKKRGAVSWGSGDQQQSHRARRGGKSRQHRPRITTPVPEGHVRIQKYLADCGVGSRRGIEEMVELGLVMVNGKVSKRLPIFIDPESDEISVEGRVVRKRPDKHVYYLLNKPKNVVCTSSDPLGRKKAVDFLSNIPQRIYCVGRLDADSTGLLILTNDGEFTQYVTHPSHLIPKTYIVTVSGKVEGASLEKLKKGIYLDGRKTAGAHLKIVSRGHDTTTMEISLREGRNREIRRMLLRVGHKVRALKRISIGPLKLDGLPNGYIRELSPREIQQLRDAGEQ